MSKGLRPMKYGLIADIALPAIVASRAPNPKEVPVTPSAVVNVTTVKSGRLPPGNLTPLTASIDSPASLPRHARISTFSITESLLAFLLTARPLVKNRFPRGYSANGANSILSWSRSTVIKSVENYPQERGQYLLLR